MRYFKMITYVSGGDPYETNEKLIDEPTFRKYQQAFVEGKEVLILEDRVIKLSSIKEIQPADDIVKEYLAVGIPLKSIGLKEPTMLESGKPNEASGFSHILADKKAMVSPEERTEAQEEAAKEERRLK